MNPGDVGLRLDERLEFTYCTCRVASLSQGKAEVIPPVERIRIRLYCILERLNRACQVTFLREPGSEFVCGNVRGLPNQSDTDVARRLAGLLRPRRCRNSSSRNQQLLGNPLR